MGTVKKGKPVKIKFEATENIKEAESKPDITWTAKEISRPRPADFLSSELLANYYGEIAVIEHSIREYHKKIERLYDRKRLLQEQPDKFIAITTY